MTSYLNTLEKAYYSEHGQYIAFPFYGAAKHGKGRCEQPDGAKRLGFHLKWCQGISSTEPVRYAYKVEVIEGQGYAIYAESGSDRDRDSFICFGNNEVDRWSIHHKTEKKTHLADCRPSTEKAASEHDSASTPP